MNEKEALDFLNAPDEQPKQKMSKTEAMSFLEGPSKEENSLGKIMDWVGNEVKATPRVIGSTLAGLAAWPVQKSFEAKELMMGGSKEDIVKAGEYVQGKIPKWLQPKSAAESSAINKLGAAMEVALKPAMMAGEQAEANWGHRAGWVTQLVGELFTFKGLHKLGVAGKLKANTVNTAKQVLGKKLGALTEGERYYINEIVKQHKTPELKFNKKQREQIEKIIEESDPNKPLVKDIETEIIRDEFNKVFKTGDKAKTPVEEAIKDIPVVEEPKVTTPTKTAVKKPVEIKTEAPVVEQPKVIPPKKKESKIVKQKKEKQVSIKQQDLTQPAIRTSDGTVYLGEKLSDTWSISKPKVAVEEGPRSYSVARERARSAGKKLNTKDGKKYHDEGFVVDGEFVSTKTIAEKFRLSEKVANKKAARIAKQGKDEIKYLTKQKEKVVKRKKKLETLRETTEQDTKVIEGVQKEVKRAVYKEMGAVPLLSKSFKPEELINTANEGVVEFILKQHPSEIDAFINGGVDGRIRGSVTIIAKNRVKNHIKEQLGLKQGKARSQVVKELESNTFRETISFEEGKGSSVAELKESLKNEAHFEGKEAPRSGKSVKDKTLGKPETKEEGYAYVKKTAGEVKKLTVKEYLAKKKKEQGQSDKATLASQKKGAEKFKAHVPTLGSKAKDKLSRAERKEETDLLIAKTKAAIVKDKDLPLRERPVDSQENVVAKGGTTFYSGFPVHKMAESYTKYIGQPIWDKVIIEGLPKLFDKIPVIGKPINRALLYNYRGNLKNTSKFIESIEQTNRNKALGREYAVDLGNRLQARPEDSQLRIAEALKGGDPKLSKGEMALAQEAKQVLFDLGKQAVDIGLLNKKEFFKNAGKYMPRLYTKMEYRGMLKKFGVKAPAKLDLSRFKQRLDIEKEKRKAMGEILTPGYPVAKGIRQLTHDIELGRFFEGISKNKDWAYDPATKKTIPKGFKKLPSQKKLGKLSGKYVHPEIYEDITLMIREQGKGEKVWNEAIAAWKFGKVVMSPKTHARNMMSNAILAHLGGLPLYAQAKYLYKAAKDMKANGSHYKNARKEGLMSSTYTNAELKSMFLDVESSMKGSKAGGLPEQIGMLGNAISSGKKGAKKLSNAYEFEEQVFKMAKFIHNVEKKKMGVKEAAMDAEKWLFNYSKVTKAQHKYRTKWYGAPFATFTLKAIPRIAEAAVVTPHRFLLPAAMIYALEEAARSYHGDTREQATAKKEFRPEFMKKSWLDGIIPSFPRVPFRDEAGRDYSFDLSYILPWGDVAEQGTFLGIPGGLMPGSMPIFSEAAEQLMNFDAFYQQPIVKEEDLAGKSKLGRVKVQTKKRLAHVAKTALPTPFLGAEKIYSNFKGKPDYQGRFKPPGLTVVDELLGIKMYPVDYVNEMVRSMNKLDPESGQLSRKLMRQIQTLSVKKNALQKKGKNTDYIDDDITDKINQIKGMAKELAERGKEFGKTRKKSTKQSTPF